MSSKVCVLCNERRRKHEVPPYFTDATERMFFRWPSETKKAERWLQALQSVYPTMTVKPHQFICSLHFGEGTIKGNKRKFLLTNATPVVDWMEERTLRIDGSVYTTMGTASNEAPTHYHDQTDHTYTKRLDIGFIRPVNPTQTEVCQSPIMEIGAEIVCESRKEHQSPQELQKRRVYLRDYKIADMNSQPLAKSFFRMVEREVKKSRRKILGLQRKLREMKKPVQKQTPTPIIEQIEEPLRSLVERSWKKNGPYTAELKVFALNLNFESPAAYSWLRNALPKGVLPHPMTLRNWYKGIDGSAGFTSESLRAINLQISADRSKRLVLALAVDEMAIKRHVVWDKHSEKFIGHVSFGSKFMDDLATKVIVFLATAMNGSWKIPIGYFFVNGLDHNKRAVLLEQCLYFMKDLEADIASITFDGDPANLKMVETLGASLNAENLKPYFTNPHTGAIIYIILDMVHAIKLVRNNLAKQEYILYKGNKIEWRFYAMLECLQTVEGLHLGTKITPRHIAFELEKMKARLALQIFSESTACALEYLQNTEHPGFEEVGETIYFTRAINDVFDIFNTKNLNDTYYKHPLTVANADVTFEKLEEVEECIRSIQDKNGREVFKTKIKTGFLGILINIQSLRNIYQRFVTDTHTMSFICTYKLSQDHLELLFALFRKRCGFGDNPTSQQFTTIYLKSLVHCELKTSFATNCLSQDNTSILNVSKSGEIQPNYMPCMLEATDEEFEQFCREEFSESEDEEEHSKFVNDVTFYISGFVSKTARTGENYDLIRTKDRGGLHYASETVENLCQAGEKILRKYTSQDNIMAPNLLNKMVGETKQQLSWAPFVENPDSDDHGEHLEDLVDRILKEFFNIRLFHVAKLKRDNIRKQNYRSRNRKTVHNAGF